MSILSIDNEPLHKSTALLAALKSAQTADTIKPPELMHFTKALGDEYGRVKDCEDMIEQSRPQIESLEKALKGWQDFLAYQERRLPGLKRRYNAARDYIRAAEDEQTGHV